MKKHLKKLMLLTGFIAIAAVASARVWHIKCNNGREYNYISLEEENTLAEMRDVDQAIDDLCS